ncbi:MAG: cell wall-associated protein wapA [Bdellovibrio sp.]|nr:cell wall-associated protein wapA [Bdellovibrio sp.]
MKHLLLSFAIVTLFFQSAHALVDMNNASYSNTWIDMEVPGSGYDMKIVRSYKSRTIYNGIFGFGWCSNFETKLTITSEGNIKITECGDGQEVVFSAREITKKDIDNTIAQIINKMKGDPKVKSGSPDYFKQLSAQLLEDDDKRSQFARQYGVNVQIKEGTKFMANGKEVENVVLAKGFYTRNLPDGSYQRYDLQGRITHMYDKNGNFLKFDYEKDLLKELEDNNSRKIAFKYYPNKKVKQIIGPNGLNAEYKYSAQEDLIWSKNMWAKKNTDVYTYEFNEVHNLTKASWPDKTFALIRYDNIKDWVIGYTDREKCVENYKYDVSPNDPKFHYWSEVKKVCGKETVANNRYEFWHKQLPSGQVILSRVLTSLNGSTTDISYHDVFGKPVSIKKNNEKINFDYYADGLIKTKSTPLVKVEFTHDATSKKVSTVKMSYFSDKGKVVSTRNTIFKYDTKGNLTYAENTDGQKINMTYDEKGRISSILDQAKKVVKIDYEERFGKPNVVSRPGLGTIKVSYKTNGDIAKVDSPEGETVASQVASTFNNLLDVIAPATQELYL